MRIYKEGQKNNQDSPQFKDFIELDYISNKLTVGMKNPAKQEIKEYKFAPIIFKLIIRSKVILITFKIGTLDWSDFAYSICTFPKNERKKYKEKFNEDYPKELNLLLIDVNSNLIKVNRILKLNDKFAKKLRNSVLEQCDSPHSVTECDAEIKKIYNEYNPEQLSLSKLVNATCKIPGLSKMEHIEVIYDEYGYGTNKKIPKWIYSYIHDSKTNDNKGIITKKDIPDELLGRGVVKCTYSRKYGKHLYVALYKLKKVKK